MTNITIYIGLTQQKSDTIYINFDSIIWKILPDSASEALILELRDPDTRAAAFSCVDIFSLQKRWEGISGMEEDWWMGLAATAKGYSVFYSIEEVDKPSFKGMFAVNNGTGKVVWQNGDWMYKGMAGDGMLMYGLEGEEIFYADIQTGKKKEDETIEAGAPAENFILPSHYISGHSYFDYVGEYLQTNFQAQAVGAIDYLEYNGFIIIAYYIVIDGKLDNYLLILNKDGQIILLEKLGSGLSGIASESYFVYDSTLVFVKNKNTLGLYRL